ncbi:hypothetical protein KSS87_010060, partial [Heliosperma pusillum]
MSYDINIINTPRLTTRGEPDISTTESRTKTFVQYVFSSCGITYNNPTHKL